MAKCEHWCKIKDYVCRETCPKNADRECNIIPVKKPRFVRVKAWAGSPWTGKIKTLVWFANKKGGSFKIPVTILIDRKYLKEASC